MRQAAAGVLRRLSGLRAGSLPLVANRSCSEGLRAAASSHRQWLACISPMQQQSRLPVQSFHAAHFSSAATSQTNAKDGRTGTSADESPAEDKSEPVCKSGKDEKKAAAGKGDGKATAEGGKGDGDKKPGDADKKPAAEEKKVPETPEQKLLKEVKRLEQLIREKDSILEEKEDLVKELKDNVLRGYAELENFRERAKREQENSRKFAVQSFSKDLLDVSDNLSRALSSVGQPKDAEELKKVLDTLVEGVKMTEKQLLQVFKKYGVQRFDPTGEPFDPNVHFAVCEIADPSKPAGTVATVFKVGYLLHERVLRPAEVAVVKAAEAAA